jgi:hypothetical protein
MKAKEEVKNLLFSLASGLCGYFPVVEFIPPPEVPDVSVAVPLLPL